MMTFFVPGIPQPGGSKRAFVVRGRAVVTEDARRSKDWRASVALAASVHCPSPLAGPVAIEFHFVFPRPRGHFGTGRNASALRASAPQHHVTKPDCTKLTRSTEDALKGIAWGGRLPGRLAGGHEAVRRAAGLPDNHPVAALG